MNKKNIYPTPYEEIVSALLASFLLVMLFVINTNNTQMERIEKNYQSAKEDPLKARIYTLKNGLTVYLSVYKDAPRVQTYVERWPCPPRDTASVTITETHSTRPNRLLSETSGMCR